MADPTPGGIDPSPLGHTDSTTPPPPMGYQTAPPPQTRGSMGYGWPAPPAGSSYGTSYGTGFMLPNGMPVQIPNAGTMDPRMLNPSAGQYLGQNGAMYAGLQYSVLSPYDYKSLQDTSQANLTTSMGNQYAHMGLSGSSAEMGGLNQGIQNNQMSWLNRQQGDYAKYLSAGEGLTNQGYAETMGIQNQYQQFSDTAAQDMLNLYGMQQATDAGNNQAMSAIFAAGLGAAGTFAGSAARPGYPGGYGSSGDFNPYAGPDGGNGPGLGPYGGVPGGGGGGYGGNYGYTGAGSS